MAYGYRKIRYLGSTVHIYEYNQRKEEPRLEYGTLNKLEKLSMLGSPKTDEEVKAKINFGFFNFNASSENLGTFSDNYTTITYGNDTVMRFYDAENMSKTQIDEVKKNSLWIAGASFTLVENGKVSIRNTSVFPHWTERHPRTILGQKKNLDMMLIVVQGRRLNEKGMTATEEAKLCLELGLYNAVNLDGGGSSEMIVDNKIVNKPTDGSERSIGSALVVYGKRQTEVTKKTNIVIAYSQQKNNKCILGDTEQDHTNEIALIVYDIIRKDERFNTYLIPKLALNSDKERLKESVRLSNTFINANDGVGYHLEFHTDAGDYATGASGLFYSEAGKKFIEPIINDLMDLTPWKDAGIRQRRDLLALRGTKAISGIIEISFHDNVEEAQFIHKEKVTIAARIVNGLYKSLRGGEIGNN